MTVKLTDDEFEERLAHTGCAATVTAYRGITARLATKAGEAFVAGDEALARAFKAFREELLAVQKTHETELDHHILRARGKGSEVVF